METYITDDLSDTLWINGLQRQVDVRKKALPELMFWCDKIEGEFKNEYASTNESDGSEEVIYIFRSINHVVQSDSSVFTNEELSFLEHAESNLIFIDPDNSHLPIPVYSYLKPSMGVQFLHHILLSMGILSTGIELKLHGTIRDCFRYAKLIGPDDDITSLENYSYEICARYIKEQLRYFPNAMQTLINL